MELFVVVMASMEGNKEETLDSDVFPEAVANAASRLVELPWTILYLGDTEAEVALSLISLVLLAVYKLGEEEGGWQLTGLLNTTELEACGSCCQSKQAKTR